MTWSGEANKVIEGDSHKIMAKLFLFIALTTTQLLSGSGDAVYLCLTQEGDICCIDPQPEPCCCPKHRAKAKQTLDLASSVADKCCEDEGCRPSVAVDGEAQIGDSDRCTKILLVSASSGTPAGTVGNCPPVPAHSDLVAMSLVEAPAVLREHFRRSGGDSFCPQSFPSALATIMLRC